MNVFRLLLVATLVLCSGTEYIVESCHQQGLRQEIRALQLEIIAQRCHVASARSAYQRSIGMLVGNWDGRGGPMGGFEEREAAQDTSGEARLAAGNSREVLGGL